MLSEVFGNKNDLQQGSTTNTRRLLKQLRRLLRRRHHIVASNYPPIVPLRFTNDAIPLCTSFALLARFLGREFTSLCLHTSAYGDVLHQVVAEKWYGQKTSNYTGKCRPRSFDPPGIIVNHHN